MAGSPFLLLSGFHRSGTSLVAQTLHANGVDMGADLMGASFANPNGHFEDNALVELHDSLLHSQGLTWQSAITSPIAIPPFFKPDLLRYADSRKAKLNTQFVGAKDPRALHFLPAWREAFNSNVVFLLVFRSWRYSVSSLLKRHSRILLNYSSEMTSREEDFSFWQQPNLAAQMWAASAQLTLKQFEQTPECTLLFPLDDFLAASTTFQKACAAKNLPCSLFNLGTSYSPSLLQKGIPASSVEMIDKALVDKCDELENALYHAFGSEDHRQDVAHMPSSDLVKKVIKKYGITRTSFDSVRRRPIALKSFSVDNAISLISLLSSAEVSSVVWTDLINREDLDNASLQRIFEVAMRYRQLDIAEIAMQRSLVNHPASWRWMNLGDVYFQKKLYDSAKHCYQTAQKQTPTNATFYARLADVETIQGNLAQARALINKACEIDSEKPAIALAKKRLQAVITTKKGHECNEDNFLQPFSDYQDVVNVMTNDKNMGLVLDNFVVKSHFVSKNLVLWLKNGLGELSSSAQQCLLDYLISHLEKQWGELVLQTELLQEADSALVVQPKQNIVCSEQAKVGVHIHVYYPSLLPEILSFVANIEAPLKLIITCDKTDRAEVQEIVPKGTLIYTCENRGRDIAPWLLLAAEQLSSCEVALKLHTKASKHDSELYGWRLQILWCLLGSNELVKQAEHMFRDDPSLVIVQPLYHPKLKGDINWGDNELMTKQLAQKLNIPLPTERIEFPAGSMFWYRPSALKSITGHNWHIDDFPAETGQVDGTLMHAIERLLGAFESKVLRLF